MVARTGKLTWTAVGPVWGHNDDCDRESCGVDGTAWHVGFMARSHVGPRHAFQRAVRAYQEGKEAEVARVEAQERGA
jgi:hypothetical protein